MGNQFSHTRVLGCTRTKVSFDCLRRLKLSAIIKILVTNQRFSMGRLWQRQSVPGSGISQLVEGEELSEGGVGGGNLQIFAHSCCKIAQIACSLQYAACGTHTPSLSLCLSLCVCPFQVTCAVHRIRLHTRSCCTSSCSSCTSCEGFGLAFSLCGMRPLLVYFINSTDSQRDMQAVAGRANQLVRQSVTQSAI